MPLSASASGDTGVLSVAVNCRLLPALADCPSGGRGDGSSLLYAVRVTAQQHPTLLAARTPFMAVASPANRRVNRQDLQPTQVGGAQSSRGNLFPRKERIAAAQPSCGVRRPFEELPSHFASAAAVNAIDGLRSLSAAASVARLVPLRELHFRRPTEVVGAVIHFTLLVELDVAHLLSLVTIGRLEVVDERERLFSEMKSTNGHGVCVCRPLCGLPPIARSVPQPAESPPVRLNRGKTRLYRCSSGKLCRRRDSPEQ
jgi:hypothetical protein